MEDTKSGVYNINNILNPTYSTVTAFPHLFAVSGLNVLDFVSFFKKKFTIIKIYLFISNKSVIFV